MAEPPGGPQSGGMQHNNEFANEYDKKAQQHINQQQRAVSPEQQPTQQQQAASTPADRQPTAEDRNLDENERRAAQQAQERARIRELADKFAPKPQQEQQPQLQRQPEQER